MAKKKAKISAKPKEKTFTFKITEKELSNAIIRKHLIAIVELKIKLQKHKPYLTVSKVEYEFIRYHRTWRKVEDYIPNKKDRLNGEMGKYNGRRTCVRGIK